MASRIEPLMTVADLDACPDDGNRYELIGGELFVSRAPRLAHQLVLQHLQMSLYNYLQKHPVGLLAPGPGAVFSESDAVIPDLVFARKERLDKVVANGRFIGPPDLVIEVLSLGNENRERDLTVKRQLYAKYGVEEYWIVDSENRCVLVYRLQGNILEEVAKLGVEDEITTPFLPQFQLRVSSIFNF
jgi:Uma2 family endonuclease